MFYFVPRVCLIDMIGYTLYPCHVITSTASGEKPVDVTLLAANTTYEEDMPNMDTALMKTLSAGMASKEMRERAKDVSRHPS